MTSKTVEKQLRLLNNVKTLLNVRRKKSLVWCINKDFYLKNAEKPSKFRQMYKQMEQVKLANVLKKYPKLAMVMHFE